MILTELDTPGPSVEVLVNAALSGTDTVTVWRTAAGVQHRVRGMIGIPYLGAAARIDYDVPLGVQVEYRVECFDNVGERIGFTSPETITVGADSSWLHNPLAPSGAVPVQIHGKTPTLDRPTPSDVVYPIGRRVGVVVGSTRRGLASFPMEVWSDSLQTADQIQALIGGDGVQLPPILCVRVGGDETRLRVPKPLYMHVPTITEVSVDWNWGGDRNAHFLDGPEVAPPALALFIPLLRRKDLDAFYTSRDLLDAAYQDRLAVDRDYSLAGYADI